MGANNLTNLPLDQRTPITDGKGVPTPQFMRLWQLLNSGGSSLPTSAGFNAEGLLADGEELAVWAFPQDVTFSDASTNSFFIAVSPAAVEAVLSLEVDGTQVGTITYPATELTGTVAFTGASYTLAAQTEMRLYAPAAADITLAGLYGNLIGA